MDQNSMALILVQTAISAQRKTYGNVSDNFIPESLKFEIDDCQIHAKNESETPRNFGQIRDWLKSRSEKEPDCTAKDLAIKLQGWLQTPLRTKCASTRHGVSSPVASASVRAAVGQASGSTDLPVPPWFKQFREQQDRKEAALMELLRTKLERPTRAALRDQTADEAEAMAADRRALADQAAQAAAEKVVELTFIEENRYIWEEETKIRLEDDMKDDVKDEMKKELKQEMALEVKEDLREEVEKAILDDIKQILEKAFEEDDNDDFEWHDGEIWQDNLRAAIFKIRELANGKRSTKRRLNEAPGTVMHT
jgi:hypothetical protein